MGHSDLWNDLPQLVENNMDGQAMFANWMKFADQDLQTRGEKLEDFVRSDNKDKLLKERARTEKRMGLLLPNVCKRHTRAIWIGLFEEARAKGYTLTTYVSTSRTSSTDDDEWECSGEIYKGSYTPLPSLTRAHQKPDSCTQDTGSILYIMLPVVFLMSILVQATHLPKLARVEEFGVGWDDGDLFKWRR